MWTFSNAGVAVRSHGDMALLRKMVAAELRRVPPRSSFMVDLDGFVLEPRFTSAYGALVKDFVAPAGHKVVRYGGAVTATTGMRAAAMKGGFSSHVFKSRSDALHALRWLPSGDLTPQSGTRIAAARPVGEAVSE